MVQLGQIVRLPRIRSDSLSPDSPSPEHQEPDHVPSNRSKKHTAVKRHNSQHHHVREPRTHCIECRLRRSGGDIVFPRFQLDDVSERKPLNRDGHRKDQDQTQGVHGGTVAGPAGEQHIHVVAPVERRMYRNSTAAQVRRHRGVVRRSTNCFFHNSRLQEL